jgi:ubiquinone/menaquinone biosynthesis C-methylase UbiE
MFRASWHALTPLPASLLPDYSRQAPTYDRTRAASPSVLAPLRLALSGAPGPRLADIGGGTGDYAAALAREGWEPVVVDRSPEMLACAREKGLATVAGDAQRLALADASFDAAMLVSMLHHVEDRAAALAEARRILRPGGRLAVMLFTREDADDLWFLELFPSTRAWMHATHPPLEQLLELLPGARRYRLVFEDLDDASLAALASHPDKVLDERWRRQTSYFERLQRDDPDELRAGLDRLTVLLAAGDAPTRPGTASVLAWTKP